MRNPAREHPTTTRDRRNPSLRNGLHRNFGETGWRRNFCPNLPFQRHSSYRPDRLHPRHPSHFSSLSPRSRHAAARLHNSGPSPTNRRRKLALRPPRSRRQRTRTPPSSRLMKESLLAGNGENIAWAGKLKMLHYIQFCNRQRGPRHFPTGISFNRRGNSKGMTDDTTCASFARYVFPCAIRLAYILNPILCIESRHFIHSRFLILLCPAPTKLKICDIPAGIFFSPYFPLAVCMDKNQIASTCPRVFAWKRYRSASSSSSF